MAIRGVDMSKVEYRACDLCGSRNNVEQHLITVIFTTEQTEGRSCPHYLSPEKVDLCDDDYQSMVTENRMPYGLGAQGHNLYAFTKAGLTRKWKRSLS